MYFLYSLGVVTFNKLVTFDFLFTKLSAIDPCEKHINIPGGHACRQFFMACSKLEAMAIYLVKLAFVYNNCTWLIF